MQFTRFLKFVIIFGLTLGISCSVSISTIPEVDTVLPVLGGRIINGTKAFLGEFPHQVSLRRSYSDRHFCGGSIISEQWVLTAAHCMFRENNVKIAPWTITVTAGHVQLNNNNSNIQKHAVTEIIMHEDFDRPTMTNDIALLKMRTPFNLNTTYVKAAKLGRKISKPGTICQVSGWGTINESPKPVVSNDLMFVDLPLINRMRCKELLVNVTKFPLGMFCAGYEEGLRDACQGDSGGGMICDGTLTGIVSDGEGCARPALPGFYTDVPYYYNWVMHQMRSYNESNGRYIDAESTSQWNRTNSSPKFYLSLPLTALLAACSLRHFLGVTMFDRLYVSF